MYDSAYICIFCTQQKGETMTVNPIIPIWLMVVICISILLLKKKKTSDYIRQIIVVLLLFVINLRIIIPGDKIKEDAINLDVIFVIDNTISMVAEDYEGYKTRLEGVKEDCNYIIDEFSGASFKVISFADTVEMVIPYNMDTHLTKNSISYLKGQMEYYAKGTSLNLVMKSMKDNLEDERDTYKILFFISDGEIVSSEQLKEYDELEGMADGGAVIGYGTKDGGYMKPAKMFDEPGEYLYYYEGNKKIKALSKIDEGNLKKIAEDFGIEYVHSEENFKDTVEKIKADIMKKAGSDKKADVTGKTETYHYFAAMLVVMLITDVIYQSRKE